MNSITHGTLNLEAIDTPIEAKIVQKAIKATGLQGIGKATIREIKALVDNIVKQSGTEFIRMEMGVPGIFPSHFGIDAQIDALRQGVAAKYPDIGGIPDLKAEISRFALKFINISVHPDHCIPTVGSMQGSFGAFLTLPRVNTQKNTILFIDPGFPVHKQQCRVLGVPFESFDVYNYRGEKLEKKLRSYLEGGHICALLYSNPNNPSWICFTERELEIIGKLSKEYGVVVLEDLAYFGMDFRKDYSSPGAPPYQPSVAHYTDQYILFISSSKAFSYAGERIGMMLISDNLFLSHHPDLKRFYSSDQFGYVMIFGTIYSLSSGTSHSAQYALKGMLKAANDGEFHFLDEVREYGRKAETMKKLFTDNGFRIVYDQDEDAPIADGFYFTVSYSGFKGEELLEEFLYYGISAISLAITGSERTEGIRACVSQVRRDQFPELEKRLSAFHHHHPIDA